jgi:hypothetical protein
MSAMETTPGWTLEELCRRAALVLRGVPGAREPDARAVRWYAGTGLVDRPVGGRGRGARYGVRHLRQLVVIRRLQAQGWALADIQGELAGADDEQLRALAPLPDLEVLDREVAAVPAGPVPSRDRFWAHGPQIALAPGSTVHLSPDDVGPVEVAVGPEPGAVRLADGVVLVLPRRPSPVELSLVAEAAAPLVTVLASLGLAARGRSGSSPGPAMSGPPPPSDRVPPSTSAVPGGSS